MNPLLSPDHLVPRDRKEILAGPGHVLVEWPGFTESLDGFPDAGHPSKGAIAREP